MLTVIAIQDTTEWSFQTADFTINSNFQYIIVKIPETVGHSLEQFDFVMTAFNKSVCCPTFKEI